MNIYNVNDWNNTENIVDASDDEPPVAAPNNYLQICKIKTEDICFTYILPFLYCIWVVFVILLALFVTFWGFYLLFLVIMCIVVAFGETLRVSGKYIFGTKIYNEYFEVCKNTTYNGNSCFTETKTYCY